MHTQINDVVRIHNDDLSFDFLGQVAEVTYNALGNDETVKIRPWTKWDDAWFIYPDDTLPAARGEAVTYEIINASELDTTMPVSLATAEFIREVLIERDNMREALIVAGERMIIGGVSALNGDLEKCCEGDGNWIVKQNHWEADITAGKAALDAALVDSELYYEDILAEYSSDDDDDDEWDDDYDDGHDFDPDEPPFQPIQGAEVMFE